MTSRWLDHHDSCDPRIDPSSQPVLLGDCVYAKGMSDSKRTPWKYSISKNSPWSQLPLPPNLEIGKYVLTTYRSQLVWIGGTVPIAKYELKVSNTIFVLEEGKGWKGGIIPPLPEELNLNNLLATSDGEYLIVTCREGDKVKLLIYDGHEWKQRDGPDLEGWMVGCIIAHKGTVFLTEHGDSTCFFYKTSQNSLLAVTGNSTWKSEDPK